MEQQRYWWIVYLSNDKSVAEDVTDKHPFIYIEELNNLVQGEWYGLINWRQIEVEDYNLWYTLTDDKTT